MANIDKLKSLLNEALEKETPESLQEWLKSINHKSKDITAERTRIKELINELNTQITHLLILLYELDQEAAQKKT